MIISYSIFTMFMHCCSMMFHRHPVLGHRVGALADDAGHIREQQQPQVLAVGGYVSKMRMTMLCLITSASDRLDRSNYLLATHHPSTITCYFSRSLRCRLCCVTHDYATKVMADMAGWIARHPSSRMRRWSLDDINMTMLKHYLGLCINTGILRKKNIALYW